MKRAALLASVLVLGAVIHPARASAQESDWLACAPVTFTVQGGVDEDRWAVNRAVIQIEQASHQLYQQVRPDQPADLTIIIWADREDSRYLQGDDGGRTMYPVNGQSSMDLLMGHVTQRLAMHELMLSRGIREAPDPGGLLDHYFTGWNEKDNNADYYPAQDQAMIAETGCVG